MPSPADRIEAMPRSGIRTIMDLAAGRDDVVHLEVGQPDFPTPDHVVAAAVEAARRGPHGYTPNKGLPALREAIAGRLADVGGVDASADEIVVGCGAVNVLYEALVTIVAPGDAIAVPDPGWPNYAMMADLLDARAVPYPLDAADGYEPDPERVAAVLAERPDVRAIVLNSPNNPSGAVYRPETVRDLVDVAARADVYVVSDECYGQVVFDGATQTSAAAYDPDGRVVTIQSVSKAYAMTGWRLGWAFARQPLADLIAKVQEPVVACAPGISQMAALAALTGDQSVVDHMVATYQRRRDVAVELLDAAGIARSDPRGAFYVLVDASVMGPDTYATAERLVVEHGLATAPGETFGAGGRGRLRLSLATATEDVARGIGRLIAAFEDAAST